MIGFSHIAVFIAGAIKRGFLKSHARIIDVARLSHKPFAILPNVFAEHGAITHTSALFLKSICVTVSPRFPHRCHSDESL